MVMFRILLEWFVESWILFGELVVVMVLLSRLMRVEWNCLLLSDVLLVSFDLGIFECMMRFGLMLW